MSRHRRGMAVDPSPGGHLARISTALTAAPADVNTILTIATSALSRMRPAIWVATVMNPNPETSRVVVADDAEQAMADYVNGFVAAIDRPHRSPTVGLARQVIESDTPILMPRIGYEEMLDMVSPAGQAFMRANTPPYGMGPVGVLVVPMRFGTSTVGTLAAFDWRQEPPFAEADLRWVQEVADRIALSVEVGRLASSAEENSLRLEVIRAIDLAIQQRRDVGLITRVAVEQVTARLGIDAADILLSGEGADAMVLAASAGFRAPLAAGYRAPAGAVSTSGPPWRPRADVLHVDGKAHNPRASQFAREGFQTMLTVQLHAGNRLVGVLELFQRAPVEWEPALDFFDTLGGLVGVAIDYASAPTTDMTRERTVGSPRPALSDLELSILRLIVEGFTNRDIAEQVHRSENTIKFHVRRILDKTKTSNRTELARRATRDNWL